VEVTTEGNSADQGRCTDCVRLYLGDESGLSLLSLQVHGPNLVSNKHYHLLLVLGNIVLSDSTTLARFLIKLKKGAGGTWSLIAKQTFFRREVENRWY